MRNALPVMLALLVFLPAAAQDTPLKVVGTVENYASVAREIGGDRVIAEAIAPSQEDPHFIRPKPSYALMLRDADLFVSTGLDLELWAPVLVNKSGNRRIVDGGEGYVSAAHDLDLLQKPSTLSRLVGDVHIYGNPHVTTSPINMKTVAHNIATGLCKVDPGGCAVYEANLAMFKDRLSRRLYGDALVDAIGADTLDVLAATGDLLPFLEEEGAAGELGGWLGAARALRGKPIICYHMNWAYFTGLFGLEIRNYVEPKPGIPPTARHVANLIRQIPEEKIPVLLAANYFERRKPQMIADRTGIIPVVVPMNVRGEKGVDSYFDLVDVWVERLSAAYVEAETREHARAGAHP